MKKYLFCEISFGLIIYDKKFYLHEFFLNKNEFIIFLKATCVEQRVISEILLFEILENIIMRFCSYFWMEHI